MEDNTFADSAITDSFRSDGQDPIEETLDSGIIYADDLILSSEEDSVEEMMLPTQEEFNIQVRTNVLTSTDPNETLADRLEKIMTPTKSLTLSFNDDSF